MKLPRVYALLKMAAQPWDAAYVYVNARIGPEPLRTECRQVIFSLFCVRKVLLPILLKKE